MKKTSLIQGNVLLIQVITYLRFLSELLIYSFYCNQIRASNGDDSCFTDYLVLPGGHCKDDVSHYSTDRFCGNQLGVQGISQPIVQESAPFILQVISSKK